MAENPTIKDVLGGIKTLVDQVPGVGVVLTSERYVDDEAWVSLFTSMNPGGEARGVMCLWQELVRQTKGPRVCTVQQRHRFSFEVLEPFNSAKVGGLTSDEIFVARLEAINDRLNLVEGTQPPWDLGMSVAFPDADIEHQFLQSDGPRVVRRWGAGPTAIKTHWAGYTLDVLAVVRVH